MINVYTQVIAGRTIALAFDMQAWVDVEATFGGLSEMAEKLPGLDARFDLIAILARGGARKKPELSGAIDRQWLIDNATPHEMMMLVNAANHNIADNMAGRETVQNDKPVDVTLEELEAKNARS